MNEQKMLKQDYHAYLNHATLLHINMRRRGIFEMQTMIPGHELKFSYEGTIRIDNSEPIAIDSVDSILYACFPSQGNEIGYKSKPQNLQQVVPNHMRILKDAIFEVSTHLDDFIFYKN